MRLATLTLCLALAMPALAQDPAHIADSPLTGAEFDAYATGKTLSYAQNGVVWGSEQYLSDRRVIWAFAEDECQYGTWYEDQGNICFLYDNDLQPQCWRFFREDSGLRAIFIGPDGGTSLSEVGQSTTPLNCPGPDVGV